MPLAIPSSLATIIGGLDLLVGLSPDGATLENEVGFSGSTLGPGRRLHASYPRWDEKALDSALRIVTVHRGQCGIDSDKLAATLTAERERVLAHLSEAIAEADAEAQAEAEAELAKLEEENADSPFGLKFSPWRDVVTKHGPTKVRSARPTDAFWDAWRSSKDKVKAAGLALGKSPRTGDWEVTQWGTKLSDVKPAPAPVAYVVEPLTNPTGLLPYQPEPAARLVASLRSYGAAVDASDTGTGKTYIALAACRELGISPVICCPKAVFPSWQRAANHLGIKLAGVVNWELARRGTTEYCSVEGKLAKLKFTWSPDIKGLIFDEVHRAKGRDTLNAKLVKAARDQRIPTIALSATIGHSPLEMRAIGHLVGLHRWSDFYPWLFRHGCEKGRFGIQFNKDPRVLERLHHEIFPSHGNRTKIKDLGDLFPDTSITAESYDINGAAEKLDQIHQDMVKELRRLHAKKAEDSSAGAAILVAMLRARQAAELLKVPLFVELITDAVEEGNSVAVFVCFRETLQAITERLEADGISAATIIGGQDGEVREAGIEAFQADRTHVVVAMISAGGVGISLHDLHGNRPRLALISPTWSAVELRQALGRVHRAGGKTKSVQRIVFIAGSVEDKVRDAVAEKLNRLDTLNDGDLER